MTDKARIQVGEEFIEYEAAPGKTEPVQDLAKEDDAR